MDEWSDYLLQCASCAREGSLSLWSRSGVMHGYVVDGFQEYTADGSPVTWKYRCNQCGSGDVGVSNHPEGRIDGEKPG